jgi:hypothetical protein
MNTFAALRRRGSVLAVGMAGMAAAVCGGVAPAAEATSRELEILFEARVRPLLAARCQGCHGDKVAEAGLRQRHRSGGGAG